MIKELQIEKVIVTAKTRKLKAEYTIEHQPTIVAVHDPELVGIMELKDKNPRLWEKWCKVL